MTDIRLPIQNYHYVSIDARNDPKETLLPAETALSVSYNGINYAVMMISPTHLHDFVLGFSLSQGVISFAAQLRDVLFSEKDGVLYAEIELGPRDIWALKQQRRALAGATGCGLCGIAAVEQAFPKLTPLCPMTLPAPSCFVDLRDKLAHCQQAKSSAGAQHAAAFVIDGKIVLCREDIGRHNALDKLIGALVSQQIDKTTGFALVTSRCSVELVQKAVRAGINTLVSFASPTSMAVDWARRYNLNLIHLPRHSLPRVYST